MPKAPAPDAKTQDAGRSPLNEIGWPALLLVLVLAFAPYARLPGNPLILDAPRTTTMNPVVTEGSLLDVFTHDFWGVEGDAHFGTRSWRPAVTLTYYAQLRVFGESAAGLHLFDMALHALGALLVLALILELRPGSSWALPAASLFALHPVLSEPIASVVGRADLMASIAMLGALLVRLRARRASRPWRLEALALVLVGVALLSKEYAVVAPFLILVPDAASLLLGRLGPAERRRALVVGTAGLALLALYLVLRQLVLGALGGVPMLGPGDHPLYDASAATRIGNAFFLGVHALRLLFVPLALNYFYGEGTVPLAESLADPLALGSLAALLALVLVAFVALWRWRSEAPLVALCLFAFPLAPSLNTVSLAGVLFAERYLYLPAAGFALFLALVLPRLFHGSRRGIGLVLVIVVGGLFFVQTWQRVAEWADPESLARSTIRWYPDAAHSWFELGLARAGQGDDEGALEAFERSLEVQDRRPQVWKETGVALMRLGRFEESADAWRRSIDLAPRDDVGMLWRGLGHAELGAGQHEAAIRALSRARDLMPDDPRAASSLARARLALASERLAEGESEEALALALGVGEIETLPAEAYFAAALFAASAGGAEESRQLVERTLEVDADFLRRKHELALALDEQGRFEEAAQQLQEVLLAMPGHAPSYFNLGRVLLRGGRPAQAAEIIRRGLAFEDDPRARAMLEEARRRAREGS